MIWVCVCVWSLFLFYFFLFFYFFSIVLLWSRFEFLVAGSVFLVAGFDLCSVFLVAGFDLCSCLCFVCLFCFCLFF